MIPRRISAIAGLICFFIISYQSSAAELAVTVLQKGTGDPIEDASVVLGDTGEYDATDDKGEVSFEDIELPVKLKILNVGYETLFRDVKTDENAVTVYLDPLSFEGETLEVVAERVKEKSSKIVLTEEELRRAPGTQGDPLKAIQSLPGVVTAAEGAGLMYIRGSEPNQNIVWVNRARIGYLYHFGGLHSTISPQLIKDFNMFLGGFPVEYGDSLGGALDVKLRAPKKDRLHQTYSLGTYESSAVLEGPVFEKNGKDSVYLSARRSYVDLIFSPDDFNNAFLDDDSEEDEQDRVTEVPEFYDIQAVWQRDLVNGKLLLQHFSARDEIRLVLNSTKNTDPDVQGELASRVEYHSTSLVWEQQWSPQLNSSSSIYLINTDQLLKLGEDSTGKPYFLKIEETDLVWQPELRWQFDDTLLLTGGTEFIYANTPVDAYIGRPPRFNDLEYNLTEAEKFNIDRTYKSGMISPYVKARKNWLNGLTTQIGLRTTYLKSNGREDMFNFSPRFSSEYALTDKTMLTASWGHYVQLPDGAEWVEDAGNPELDFLESEHRIIGVRHRINDLWQTQIEAYHKPMKNLVVAYDENSPPENYDNDGTGESYGFDVLVKRDYSQGRMGWLSYSYLESTRTEKGETSPFSGDQRHTFTLVWSQPLPKSWRKWTAGFRLRLNSGKPHTPLLDRVGRCKQGEDFVDCGDQANAMSDPDFSHWRPVWGDTNSARFRNFFQFDLRIDREVRFNTWKLNFYMDILNLLNYKNISGYDYGNSYENIDNPDEETSLGLFPSFGVEATF